MISVPADTQNTLREGIIEFAFGEPDPALLALGLVRQAAAAVLDDAGPAALAYGSLEGPEALRDEIARRSAAREGCSCSAADVLVSGGNSQALDQVLTVLTSPGDVVLVAGKGHEAEQFVGSERRAFSDRAVVTEILGVAP